MVAFIKWFWGTWRTRKKLRLPCQAKINLAKRAV